MKSLWDSVLWLRRKNKQDKEEILTAVNAVQNLFKTSGEATASASDIVAPKTAYNGTTLITGTIADKTGTSEYAATASIDNTNKKIKMQVPADGKYGTKNYLYQSFSNIASLIGLTASKLVKNNTVLGITGNSSNMDTSGCDAAAAQILSGKKAGVKGNVVTGTMVNRAGTTVQAAAVTQDDDNTYFAVPEAAYYDKNSKIATANSNLGNSIENYCWDTCVYYKNYSVNVRINEYYILFTIADIINLSGATIIKKQSDLRTAGGGTLIWYLIKTTSTTLELTADHSAYAIYISPPLGIKTNTNLSFTMKTNSDLAYNVSVTSGKYYLYFTNSPAIFTGAEVVYWLNRLYYVYVIKATSNTLSVTNTLGYIYGGIISTELFN